MTDKYKMVGEILAAARREQKKSLKDASEATKIMEKHLEAVEAGDPAQLPSTPYFLLFARSYAQYLGIDAGVFEEIEDNVIGDEEGKTKDGGKVSQNGIERAAATSGKKFIKSLIYLVSAIIILFIAFLLYNNWFLNSNFSLNDFETVSADDATEVASTEEPPDIKIPVPNTPYEPPGKLQLHLLATQDVWAILVRDGDTVLNRELKVGDERRWEAKYRYQLTLGIATAVELTLNGNKLAPLTERPQTISGLEINQTNYQKFLPSEDEAVENGIKTVNPPSDTGSTNEELQAGEVDSDGL
jgi:cytoskeletal protein RodZ